MPKISVIIPYYNAEPFLKETINSVLEQTYPPYEIIVMRPLQNLLNSNVSHDKST